MANILIDYATIIALLALTLDILIQILHIWKRKSSLDISIKGATLRVAAATILLLKYVSIQEPFLLLGQAIFLSSYITYFILLIVYRKKASQRIKKEKK
jgi:uncharacterized protein with PQ loop repeat